MSRKKKARSKQSPQRAHRGDGEDRGSVALTVAWMLTFLMTSLAQAVALVFQLVLWGYPPPPREVHPLGFMPGLFLMVAIVTGLMCLVLMPVVYRVRRDPPPRPIAIAAVIVSLLPLATMAWKTIL